LDLCCGAGLASLGYHSSGRFSHVTGVDISSAALRHYSKLPIRHLTVIQADALEYLTSLLDDPPYPFPYDVIHASFPCQKFTKSRNLAARRPALLGDAPDLLTPGRPMLQALNAAENVHYVIENVPGAPMTPTVTLCGSMFGLEPLERHRLFETSFPVPEPPHTCRHPASPPAIGLYGNLNEQIPDGGRTPSSLMHAHELMGVDTDEVWLPWRWLKEGIPPAYAEYISTFVP
jgi:hypothetical protein